MRRTPGSQSSLREANARRVIGALLDHGGMSQADIARLTGLSPATVSNIVRELRAVGAVEVTPVPSGRRAVRVTVARSAGLALGIDFGHSHVRVAVADLSHRLLAERTATLDVDRSAKTAIAEAIRMVDDVLDRAGAKRSDVLGVGLGIPGPLGVHKRVGSVSILPDWVDLPFQALVADELELPVYVDNDANLGVLAEVAWGAGAGHRDIAYIKASTGVGCGLVVGGRLHRGSAGTAGEIGHSTIDDTGPVCFCGNRGCLEMFVGGPVLLELVRRSHGDRLTLRDLVRLAQQGDMGCRRVLGDAGRFIGIAVANLVNLVSPACVVVGGELALSGDVLLDPLREAVRRYSIAAAADHVQIVPSGLGDRAEVLGAVALVLQEARDRVLDSGLSGVVVDA